MPYWYNWKCRQKMKGLLQLEITLVYLEMLYLMCKSRVKPSTNLIGFRTRSSVNQLFYNSRWKGLGH